MKNLHIGIIPDGNRRYAKKAKISKKEAYKLGFKTIERIIFAVFKDYSQSQNIRKYLSKYNICELTIFVCSKDNIEKRSEEDVENIIKMIENFIDYYGAHRNEIGNLGVKINIIGNIDLIKLRSNNIYNELLNIIDETIKNDCYILNLAIAYDCKEEIINLAKSDCNLDNFNEKLWLKSNMDLVIRTGYEKRTSGFFPLQTIYTEWFFINKYWPELDVNDIFKIIKKYDKRVRRYGK